jgi:hypothetical protein
MLLALEAGVQVAISERALAESKCECVFTIAFALGDLPPFHGQNGKGLKLTLVSGQIGLVIAGVIDKLKTVFASAAKVMREALRPRPCSIVSGLAIDLAPVGTATLGAGQWGQLDLAGCLSEWTLDWYAPHVQPCVDCVYPFT